MLTRISGGRVVDPTAGRDAVGDVWIEDGRVVAPSERDPTAPSTPPAAS